MRSAEFGARNSRIVESFGPNWSDLLRSGPIEEGWCVVDRRSEGGTDWRCRVDLPLAAHCGQCALPLRMLRARAESLRWLGRSPARPEPTKEGVPGWNGETLSSGHATGIFKEPVECGGRNAELGDRNSE